MNITIFTSNSIRHRVFINRLSKIADKVFAIIEYKKKLIRSQVIEDYFKIVNQAEYSIFEEAEKINTNVKCLHVYSNINELSKESLKIYLDSDLYIVFGSSYITSWLVDFLIKKKAINIHAGLSPYYRGAACNFWAIYDNRPGYVGATIHLLSKGLDSGKILYHTIPSYKGESSFAYTMNAVNLAQKSLINLINKNKIYQLETLDQDVKLEIRYSRNIDFNELIIKDFLSRQIDSNLIYKLIEENQKPELHNLITE
jgi:folate-dependent phosphoribosylglycinamide formyltransferase PurN